MLPAFGLDGIQGLGGSWIVAPPDFDSIAHFHVLLGSPRRSILGLLRPKSGRQRRELGAGYNRQLQHNQLGYCFDSESHRTTL